MNAEREDASHRGDAVPRGETRSSQQFGVGLEPFQPVRIAVVSGCNEACDQFLVKVICGGAGHRDPVEQRRLSGGQERLLLKIGQPVNPRRSRAGMARLMR